ncbi:MAG TPA: glycosyltransferase [Tepidisphaeraceae bacterium]|jgi:glycosyltransferase involved in cell wall biosynthesis
MRVAHVVSGLDRRTGGVAATVIGLAAAQARAGLNVTVLTSFMAGEDLSAVDELNAAGVPTRSIGPSTRLAGWHRENRAATDAAVAAADVLHVHGIWEDIQHQAMRAAQRRRVPYVVLPQGMLATWSLQQKSLKKRLYLALRLRRNLNRASAIQFTTDEEARQAKPLALKAPVLIESLGIDLREFETLPEAGAFRNRFPELVGRPLVLFLSRLHPKKGLDLLIAAFAKANVGEARLVLAGPANDSYGATVENLVREHNLTDKVLFTGMLKGRDRIAALADANLFVLASYQENFGIVVPEALAAGTATILSDQVNFSEHLAGQSFAQVIPCDVDALAKALGEWLGDADRRARAGEAARPWTMRRFDWAAIAERWKTHYAALIAGGPVR